VGLLLHPYTFRNESRYLAPDYNENPEGEYEQFFKLGVDGVFSDFSDSAVAVRNRVAGDPNAKNVPEPSSLLAFGVLPLAEVLRRRKSQFKKT